MNNIRLVVLFSLLLTLNIGCYSLRKKFIRKKNIPLKEETYLQLKDYNQPKSNSENYYDYYLFALSWLKEAQDYLLAGGNMKRVKYALQEALNYIEQLELFKNEFNQQKVKTNHNFSLKEELTKLISMVNPSLSNIQINKLQHKLAHIIYEFGLQFSPKNNKQTIAQ